MRWFGAVQAQDYLGSLWAIGLRMRAATESTIEQAITERTIVRTWPLRGTLHFVAAEDARWMLKLLAPRVLASNARRLKQQQDLDKSVIARSGKVVESALRGGQQLTRPQLYQRLDGARIATADGRGLHIVWWLAHEGLICLGPRSGKQQTFVLLDEWLPATKPLSREQALRELARRYFTSHGPATLQDFIWWSGVVPAEAGAAVEMLAGKLAATTVDGRAYWQAPSAASRKSGSPCQLLPAYDEYTVAYKDRSAVLSAEHAARDDSGRGIFYPTIVIDGRIAGTWARTLRGNGVRVAGRPFVKLDRKQQSALDEAAQRYGEFLELPAQLTIEH